MAIKSRIGFFQKVSVCLMTLAFFPAVAVTPAAATSPDVGLVTKLSGEATYWNKDEQRRPTQARAFMKLRQGDHFKLAGPGSLQLLYFTSGRQET